MSLHQRVSQCLFAAGVLALGACATAPPFSSDPYFRASPDEASTIHNLIRRQDALEASCSQAARCDHVYFSRGLAALYENRELARKYFGKVIAIAPKSQLATSSRLWIKLLESGIMAGESSWLRVIANADATAKHHQLLSAATERLVRDLLDRELVIQQLHALKETDAQSVETLQRELVEQEKKVEALSTKRHPPPVVVDAATIQDLQRQVRARDRKIEELTSQLEALKRIDEEMREKIRPIKPPSPAVPPLTPLPSN